MIFSRDPKTLEVLFDSQILVSLISGVLALSETLLGRHLTVEAEEAILLLLADHKHLGSTTRKETFKCS